MKTLLLIMAFGLLIGVADIGLIEKKYVQAAILFWGGIVPILICRSRIKD